MPILPLTKGQSAVVSDSDFAFVSQWKWYASLTKRGTYYVVRTNPITGKRIYLHRVIMNAPDGIDVDHVSGDGLDNQRENLRLATRSQNLRNTGSRKGTTSQYKGVSFVPSREKWLAQITLNGKVKNLGRFKSQENAAIAYNVAALQLFGEFVHFNL